MIDRMMIYAGSAIAILAVLYPVVQYLTTTLGTVACHLSETSICVIN